MTVNIKRPFYTMATVSEDTAEIQMYGDIYETRPIDFWTDEPVEGNFILLDEFLEDLEQIRGCRNIHIRMNSCGGDAGVAITIHNRLRDLVRDGTNLSCTVDGVAMSGGSLIMCAADHVAVNPSSIIMVHKCWILLIGGYNADELREIAVSNDAYDKAQAAIYVKKTGLPESEVLSMMADTTYLTGRDALEKGFADELLDEGDGPAVAASADRKTIFAHGRRIHVAPGMSIPDSIPTVTPSAEAAPAPAVNNLPEPTGEGGNNIMTLEELRQEHPDLVSAIEASVSHDAAVQSERQRLQEIDQIAGLFSDELVQEAKYGENPCNANELAYRAAVAAAQQGQAFLENLEADSAASGADGVGAVPPADETNAKTPEQKQADAKARVKSALGKEEK